MNRVIAPFEVLAQIVYLGMAVVARRNTIVGTGFDDLIKLELTIIPSGFGIAGLEKSASSSTTVIVAFVGGHIDKVFLPDHSPDHKTKIFGHRITKRLPHQLTRILSSKLDLQVLVPVTVYFKLSFPDPLGIILDDAFDLEIGLDIEFLQSEPDREQLMTSLRIEPDLTTQIFYCLDFCTNDVFPVFIIGQEHTIVLRSPTFGSVSPVCSCQVQDFP